MFDLFVCVLFPAYLTILFVLGYKLERKCKRRKHESH